MDDSEFDSQPTTYHVKLARAGDRKSRRWITRRWTPVLLARARRVIPTEYRDRVPAEDVVAEAWLVVYEKFADLGERKGRSTPVFVSFLFEVLDRITRASLRAARDRRRSAPAGLDLTTIIDASTPALQRLVEQEARGGVLQAIESLDTAESDLLLAYVAGDKVVELAERLGEKPNTVSKRLQRILADLRALMPESVFDELA